MPARPLAMALLLAAAVPVAHRASVARAPAEAGRDWATGTEIALVMAVQVVMAVRVGMIQMGMIRALTGVHPRPAVDRRRSWFPGTSGGLRRCRPGCCPSPHDLAPARLSGPSI